VRYLCAFAILALACFISGCEQTLRLSLEASAQIKELHRQEY